MTEFNPSKNYHHDFQQRVYSPAANPNIGSLQTMTLYERQLRKQKIDQHIENEMRRHRNLLAEEESNYIKEKLAETPVALERRTRSPNTSAAEENIGNPEVMEGGITSPERALMREQRAASCRKSRINNKLKKASLQHRNDFMADKLAQTKYALSEIEQQIKNAEQRLQSKGHSQAGLAQLRAIYGFGNLNFMKEIVDAKVEYENDVIL